MKPKKEMLISLGKCFQFDRKIFLKRGSKKKNINQIMINKVIQKLCNILINLSHHKIWISFKVEAIGLYRLLANFWIACWYLSFGSGVGNSLNLPFSLGYWGVLSSGNEPWIGASYNLRLFGPVYILDVAPVRFPTVYCRNLHVWEYCKTFDST